MWGELEEEEQLEQEIGEELPTENNIEASNTDFMASTTNDYSGTNSVISGLHAPEVELRKTHQPMLY